MLVFGGLTACAGMLGAALAPILIGGAAVVPREPAELAVALAGFALTGLGVANMFPAAMARAGLLAGPNGVAVASTLGYAGFLLGPPAIGFLAGAVSLGVGLTTVSVLALAAALAPVVAVALAGFALTGLGVANMFPAAMTRAGLLAGANGVALASTLGYAGFLLGPPAIGFLAGSVSLGAGLTTVSALALVAALLALVAGSVHRPRTLRFSRPSSRRAPA